MKDFNLKKRGIRTGNGAGTIWSTRFDTDINPGINTPGLGVSIGSWLGDSSKPDFLVFWVDDTIGDNTSMHKVGRDIASTGGASWSGPKDTFPRNQLDMGRLTLNVINYERVHGVYSESSTGIISVTSIDQNSNTLTGLYVQLTDTSNNQLDQGWTPVQFTRSPGTYKVWANDYCNPTTLQT